MDTLPMILSNIRIHGVGDVIDTQWFEVAGGLTSFLLPEDFNRLGFLQALQTINPPFNCQEKKPFSDYPLIHRQGKYQKRVRPHRRTIAFAIFTAQPQLVLQLSKITPDLYETDRIEVGRRMDHTRWINFVEIASSTRWGEIEQEIKQLLADFPHSSESDLQETIASLHHTDRVKGELREKMYSWLTALHEQALPETPRKHLKNLMFTVQRQEHFRKAKDIVKSLLPTFYILDRESLINPSDRAQKQLNLKTIMNYIDNVLSHEQKEGNTNPVLLIDAPSLAVDRTNLQKLLHSLEGLSDQCHCFYLQGEKDAIESPGAKNVTLAEMLTKKRIKK